MLTESDHSRPFQSDRGCTSGEEQVAANCKNSPEVEVVLDEREKARVVADICPSAEGETKPVSQNQTGTSTPVRSTPILSHVGIALADSGVATAVPLPAGSEPTRNEAERDGDAPEEIQQVATRTVTPPSAVKKRKRQDPAGTCSIEEYGIRAPKRAAMSQPSQEGLAIHSEVNTNAHYPNTQVISRRQILSHATPAASEAQTHSMTPRSQDQPRSRKLLSLDKTGKEGRDKITC